MYMHRIVTVQHVNFHIDRPDKKYVVYIWENKEIKSRHFHRSAEKF